MSIRFFLVCTALVFPLSSCGKVRDLVSKKERVAEAGTGVVTELEAGEYKDFIEQPGKLVVVDFYADWCGPCRQLEPVLEKIAGEFPETAVVGKLNVDFAKDVTAAAGVREIPDVRFFRDGKMVGQFVGVPSEGEIREKFQKLSAGGANGAAAEPAIQPMPKDWLPPGIERR